MNVILFDDSAHESLLPLTFTRPVAQVRVGILTIAEKWAKWLNSEVSYQTADYLSQKFPVKTVQVNIFINGSVCPDEFLAEAIEKLAVGEALLANDVIVAVKTTAGNLDITELSPYKPVSFSQTISRVIYPEDIFRMNDAELKKDFALLTKGRSSANLSSTNILIGDEIFVEEGAEADCSTFNTRMGPVYLGKNSQVWEGCHIRGSFALCNDSQVKMGAKIYSGTTIGPYCRVGGEINNAVIFGYSSKGHEGYLGNSVLGEWCNIGADSNNSNLKNNYAEVRLWDYKKGVFRKTGLQFCGLIMADHSKCAINTMFNTGTVVGVSANIFGAGFPRNFIPDFSWGGAHGFEVYGLNKMFDTTTRVFERRNKVLDETEKQLLTKVFELTESYRRF
ncbi:glucose-1-phosphate thymidylyltransferase [Pedobacter sp. BS3]|uniref:GlmU family protein n=1 Tax=Pedobacter sp. BS3 TaxID=2567937 RepID=UPI0011EC643F|nr:GlmU family protein [Pedobacter sp. BS3]TZF84971.1 glucose-1-phosphate thymidylyltransferase [Pedobacter sp. BS3]